MAKQQRGWKDALQALKSEGSRSNDPIDPREQKKRSRMMYRKRKLDKDIKNYINNTTVIKSSTIDRIGQGHGFYFG